MPILTGLNSISQPQSNTPTRISSINTYFVNHGYRLANIVGEGSYSKVRLCLVRNPEDETETESSIACKIINKRRASGDFVNKFLPRELQIVSRLKHENIITVYDVIEYDQNVFIFMDYCNNGDLLEFVKRKGCLSECRSKNYFRQILSAVQYLHSLDLAHRDLKCENILLTQTDQVKLSDFGFSRYCRDNATGKRILSNTYCGSAAYAAPEILQGTMYNPKLYDMWSLGCILFIMLTGHMPYDEANIQKMLQNQIERVLAYPQQSDGVVAKQPKRLIRHLLEPDVTRRATIEQALSHSWLQSLRKTSPGPNGDIESDTCSGDSRNEYTEDFNCEPLYKPESSITPEDYGRQAARPARHPPSTSSHCSSRSTVPVKEPSPIGFLPDHIFNSNDKKWKQIGSSSGRSLSSRQNGNNSNAIRQSTTTSRTRNHQEMPAVPQSQGSIRHKGVSKVLTSQYKH